MLALQEGWAGIKRRRGGVSGKEKEGERNDGRGGGRIKRRRGGVSGKDAKSVIDKKTRCTFK